MIFLVKIEAKMSKLFDEIKLAIANQSLAEMARLIEICDKIHAGVEVEGYPFELPPDETYEELKLQYKTLSERVGVMTLNVEQPTKIDWVTAKQLSDMWMGKDAIIKDQVCRMKSQKVLIMPKYDGCSTAIRFKLVDKKFEIELAQTRGSDAGTSHKATDMTARMIKLLNSPTCPWFTRFHSLSKYFDGITIRGEVVLIKKLDVVSAAYVAGKIAREEDFPEGEIGFKMFEITRYIDKKGVGRVPSQEKACEILEKVDTSLTHTVLDLSDDQDDNTAKLRAIFDQWNKELSSPIDGVVYCSPQWKYPMTKDETGVKYGKYAQKPSYSLTSTFEGLEYSMAKDGKVQVKILFAPIANGRTKYHQAKTTFTNLERWINDKNLQVGSVLNIKLNGNLAQVSDVVGKMDGTPIKLISQCPCCEQELSQVHNKKGDFFIICENGNCSGKITKVLKAFFSTLELKGFGEITLDKMLDDVKGDLGKLFEAADKKLGGNGLRSRIDEVTVGQFMIALGVCTRTTVDKVPELTQIYMNTVHSEKASVVKYLSSLKYSSLVEAMKRYLTK